jgi:hypothetical protein
MSKRNRTIEKEVQMLNRRTVVISLMAFLLFANVARSQQSVTGTWKGTLPKANLPLEFDFSADGSGTVDSPKQNFHATATISVSGSDVTISVPDVKGTLKGTLADGKISGTWSQGSGYTDDLTLVKQ